jgi:hypothetical protein
MAVVDWTSAISGTTQNGNYTLGAALPSGVAVKKRYINCALYNMASGSYYKMFNVPANTMVLRCYAFVATIEGGTATIDLCHFLDSDTTPSSVSTLANDGSLETDDTMIPSTVGICNDAAGGIYVLANEALDAAKFWVVAEFVPLTTTD